MSFVGPRPEVRRWVDAFPDRWKRIHLVRPGLTDPASLAYCNEEALLAASADPEELYRSHILPHKLSLYESYINTRSFARDLALITQTPVVIIKHAMKLNQPCDSTK